MISTVFGALAGYVIPIFGFGNWHKRKTLDRCAIGMASVVAVILEVLFVVQTSYPSHYSGFELFVTKAVLLLASMMLVWISSTSAYALGELRLVRRLKSRTAIKIWAFVPTMLVAYFGIIGFMIYTAPSEAGRGFDLPVSYFGEPLSLVDSLGHMAVASLVGGFLAGCIASEPSVTEDDVARFEARQVRRNVRAEIRRKLGIVRKMELVEKMPLIRYIPAELFEPSKLDHSRINYETGEYEELRNSGEGPKLA